MDLQNEKCVMVIDEQLPLGIIANTAAVMGITLGKAMPEVVGADVRDESGHTHLGIIEFPVPILRGSPESIKALREKLYEPDFQALTVVDFKTDRVTAEEAPARAEIYRGQLQAYSDALSRIMEMPVERRVLYFFQCGQEISL